MYVTPPVFVEIVFPELLIKVYVYVPPGEPAFITTFTIPLFKLQLEFVVEIDTIENAFGVINSTVPVSVQSPASVTTTVNTPEDNPSKIKVLENETPTYPLDPE